MGDRRLTAGIIGIFVVILLSLALWSALRVEDEKVSEEQNGEEEGGEGDDDEVDDDGNGGEDTPEETPPDVKFHIGDMFYTDRLDSRQTPPPSCRWLTMWLIIENPSPNGTFFATWAIYLETLYSVSPSYIMVPYINNSLVHEGENVTPHGKIGGWIHFPVKLNEVPRRLAYNRSFEEREKLYLDLEGASIPTRNWTSPMDMEIEEMGRDPEGEDTYPYVFMLINVSNNGENWTHFEVWHLQLKCESGNMLDPPLTTTTNDTEYYPGRSEEFRLYFDISPESEEVPEYLVSALDDIAIPVPPSLYEGRI